MLPATNPEEEGPRRVKVFRGHRSIMSHRLLILTLLLALVLRLYHVDYPFIDHHAIKQADMAAMARNYYEDGFNFLYPEAGAAGYGVGPYETQFPAINFLIALLYVPLGVHPWVDRIVDLSFGLASILSLYFLVLRFFDRRTAAAAAVLMALNPLDVVFSRSITPEPAMVFFSLVSLLFFDRYLEDLRWWDLGVGTAGLSLALLLKVTNAFVLLPMAYLAYLRWGRKLFLQWKLLLAVGVALALVGLWYLHAYQIYLQTNLSLNQAPREDLPMTPAVLASPDFYNVIFSRLFNLVMTPPGAALFVLGLLFSKRSPRLLLPHVYLAGGFAYVAFAAKTNYIHDYYQFPLVPSVMIFEALGIIAILDRLRALDHRRLTMGFRLPRLLGAILSPLWKGRVEAFLISTLLLLAVFSSLALFDPDRGNLLISPEDPRGYNAGRAMAGVTEAGSLVVLGGYGGGWDPVTVYYTHRPSRVVGTPLSIERVEALHAQGASYFATARFDLTFFDSAFFRYMADRYGIVTDGYSYVAFDFRAAPHGVRNWVPDFMAVQGRRLGNVTLTKIAVEKGSVQQGEVLRVAFGVNGSNPTPGLQLVVRLTAANGRTFEVLGDPSFLDMPSASWPSQREVALTLAWVLPPDFAGGSYGISLGLRDGGGNTVMASGGTLDVDSASFDALDRTILTARGCLSTFTCRIFP